MEISVIIPVYNEELLIAKNVKRIKKFLESQNYNYEIIIIDDGSKDRTFQIIEENFRENDRIKILKNGKNLGKGASIRKGVEATEKELILISDADLSTPIEELLKLTSNLKNFDCLIDSRGMKEAKILKRQKKYKELLGKLGNLIIQILLLPGIKDTQCGFKLIKKDLKNIFKKTTLNRWGFDFELLFFGKKI